MPSATRSAVDSAPSSLASGPRQRVRVPAWVLSLVLHMVILLVLAVTVRGVSRGLVEEPGRSAGVVIARTSADGEVAYFDSQNQAVAATGSTGQDAAAAALEALPAADLEAPLEIQLPGAAETGGLGEQALAQPSLAGGGGRSATPSAEAIQRIMAEEAANRPAGPSGPETQLSVFGGAPARGRSFIFVIDRSKSMGGSGLGALAAARRELNGALEHLQASHELEIVAYHQGLVFLGGRRLLPATADNLRRVDTFFAGLAAFGGTNHYSALFAALDLRPDVVYLLTDGGDPYLSPGQLAEARQTARRQGTTIHTVQFGFGPLQEEDRGFMKKLALDNGGSFTYVNMSQQPR